MRYTPAMRYIPESLGILTLLLASSGSVMAQQPSAASAPGALSSSLGVVVFPSKNQTAQQQQTDEGACFAWAKTQTGIDPFSNTPPPAAAPAQPAAQAPANPGQGSTARGAARGAAGGAAIGAIAGDAGTGAAVGATVGAVRGRRAKNSAEQNAQAQQQQAAADADAQAKQALANQKATYNKAFSACLEGKGYSVK
jgi:hypothetical protein